MSWRLLLVLWALLDTGIGLLPDVARAAEAMVRIGLHNNYGRLVIEWPAPVEIQTAREGAGLKVQASHPFPARLSELSGRLHRYLAALKVDADGAGLAVEATPGVDLTFELLDERLLVLDFRAAPTELRLRVGQHPGFVRLVIEPVATAASLLQRSPAGLELDLPGPLSAWALGRLREVPGITGVTLDGNRVALGLAATATARDLLVEPDKLVIDVTPPPDAIGAPADTVVSPASPNFPLPHARPTPTAVVADTGMPAEKAPIVHAATDLGDAPVAPAALPVEGPVVITGTRRGVASTEIAFRWAAPVPAAIFVRGRSLWAVFGAQANAIEIDTEAFATAVGQHITGLRRERHGSATVLRLALTDERSALVHRDDASWVVTLRPPREPAGATGAPALAPEADGLLLPGITSVASLVDPVIGDHLGVGLALAPTGPRLVESRFVGLRLLPSAQGAVWRALAEPVEPDDLTTAGLLLAPAHGVLPTAAPPAVVAAPSTEPTFAHLPMEESARLPVDSHAADDNAGPHPVPHHEPPGEHRAEAHSPPSPLGLARFAEDDFRTRRAALLTALTTADRPSREAARLDLARLLVVNGLGAEVLELLDAATVETAEPGSTSPPAQAALTGAALLLMDRPAEAAEQLADRKLAADDETALWRGAAAAATGAWDQGLADWQRGFAHLATYPLDLQATLALPGVRLLLETGRADAAFELIDRLTVQDLRPDRLRSLRRLEATALERDGATDEALAAWQALAGNGPLEERAVARAAATALALAAGQISIDEAIATLEADRRHWRGQQEEFTLWRRLAGLQQEAGRIDEALDTLRTAMHRSPPAAEAQAITREMAAFFAEALDELAAGQRSPTSALLLYRRFAELMPVGPEGDEAAATLSAALLATGLATAGTGILDDRLGLHAERDARRARLGLMLARLHLASGAPDRALATLVDSTPLGAVDAELTADRQQLMAEALAANSTATVLTDGPAAGLLRARAAFDAGDWPAVRVAASPLEVALPESGPIDTEAGEIVLMLATAARQLGDAEEVRRLARRHAERLSSERDAALLGLLAGLPDFAGDTDRVLADATRHLHEARDVLAVLGRH
ncbi:MAG: tetratricopeptide repeat protein [Geminicoccaceae bacterium]|nr:tetratricopeptide repeat protein [Geminicoccaceae bacterium]MCB9966568.1 tetratricopeptide repeat protein [Geminicoccaceae bacterium]HRY22782.1 tetratricopeptide repeat protein [Geminicoccaceae bacterium]